MANRNEELYGYYLMAHIYSGGNCGDIAPQQMGQQSYPSADVRGNDAKAAVALGQMHGRAGNEAFSIDRLIATIGALVTEYSTKTVDLAANAAAMKDVADAGKAAAIPVSADAVAKKIDLSRQPTTGGGIPWMVPLNDVASALGPVPSRATWNNTLLKWEADIPYPNSTGRDHLMMIDVTPSHWKQHSQSPSRYQKNKLVGAARALVSALAVAQENAGPLSGNEALASLVHLHVGLGGVAMVVVVRPNRSEAFIRAEAKLVAGHVDTLFQDQAREVAHENPPNAGDLAYMKAATQGLGVATERAIDRVARLLYPWVVGSYSTGDDTTVLDQAIKALQTARERGEINGQQTIRVSVGKGDPWPSSPTAKSWEEVHGGIPWSPLHKNVSIITGVSADWIQSLGEITEKSLMDDHRIATIARSETGKSEADDVIGSIRSMAQRDHVALALSLQIMPLNNTVKLREDIRVALGFAEPPLSEWVKPGAWAFFPKASPKGDYLQVIDVAHDNVLFRLPVGRTLLCPSGVVRIAARGIHELEWVVRRAKEENKPLDQMVFIVERELNETLDQAVVEVKSRDIGRVGFPIV